MIPRIAAFILLVFLVASVSFWLGGGWNLDASSISPDGQHRIELYRGPRWQTAIYSIRYEEPGFARMSRMRDGQSLGTSNTIDLADSRITWLPSGALIATQAQYEYSTGRWN